MGANGERHVPFWGILIFGKKVFGFLGDALERFGAVAAIGCPFLVYSYFRKKGFRVFGGCLGAFWGDRMSDILIFGKKVFRVLGDALERFGAIAAAIGLINVVVGLVIVAVVIVVA